MQLFPEAYLYKCIIYFFTFQFGDHCEHLENNITLVQERVKKEAEMDDTWGDDETEDRLVRDILCEKLATKPRFAFQYFNVIIHYR